MAQFRVQLFGTHFSVLRSRPHVKVAGKWLRCARNSAEMITDSRGARGGIVSPRWTATKIIQLRDSGGPMLARPTPTAARTFDIYWLRAD
jgi:hypothetical protein